MTEKTIDIITEADALIASGFSGINYGANNFVIIGNRTTGSYLLVRALFRFPIPIFSGTIISQEFRLRALGAWAGSAPFPIGVYIVDETQGDLWIEGDGVSGGDTLGGVTWDDFAKSFPWDTAGGDFGADEISLQQVTQVTEWKVFPILKENFEFQSGKKHTLLLKFPYDNPAENRYAEFRSKEYGSTLPTLRLVIEVDGFDDPTLTAETISSTQIDISWNKSTLSDDNFAHYLLEQSDTGVGGWTTLATITDKDTVRYEHTGLVVQGDVDDYDEDSDTYPNGRTKYYRISVVSDTFGATGYGTANATTVPAIRPVSLTYFPKSKYYDLSFIDDNQAYKPYGDLVIPSWYDPNDKTEDDQVDKLVLDIYYRQKESWPGAPSITEDITIENFDNGVIFEGDTGYKPYKVDGKIYDVGGLYRVATEDKTTQQIDVVWPAPCPVAVPSVDTLPPNPPDMGSFTSGDGISVDLSVVGQQDGENIYLEEFSSTGGFPYSNGKWTAATTISPYPVPSNFDYVTDGDGEHLRVGTGQNFPIGQAWLLWKLLKGEGGITDYNKYITSYTGGYHLRWVWKMDSSVNNYAIDEYLRFAFGAWYQASPKHLRAWGYELNFRGDRNDLVLRRLGNWVSEDALLEAFTVPDIDCPLEDGEDGRFYLLDIYISPLFDPVGGDEGNVITVVYNHSATLAGVYNIDLKTHPWTFTFTDTTVQAADQPHYTGTYGIRLNVSTPGGGHCYMRIYDHFCKGRVGIDQSLPSQGYGAKNLTTGNVHGLSLSPIPSFPLVCEPDQTVQTVYVEGRVKNLFGAQSRTGEIIDYQGASLTNADPIAFLAVPKVGFKGSDVLIDASQSIDPEGGTLIYKYDFGDGQTSETSEPVVSHQYDTIGTYTVKLIVEDEAGNDSAEVETDIRIYDVLEQFEEVSLMSPWESIGQASPSGSIVTEHPELDYDTVQGVKGGNRVFNLTGLHHDPDGDIALATRVTNAENERDYFHSLYNQNQLISLDLVNFGIVKGVITDHKPSMTFNDQQAFEFSMTFQEVDVRQFE